MEHTILDLRILAHAQQPIKFRIHTRKKEEEEEQEGKKHKLTLTNR